MFYLNLLNLLFCDLCAGFEIIKRFFKANPDIKRGFKTKR